MEEEYLHRRNIAITIRLGLRPPQPWCGRTLRFPEVAPPWGSYMMSCTRENCV